MHILINQAMYNKKSIFPIVKQKKKRKKKKKKKKKLCAFWSEPKRSRPNWKKFFLVTENFTSSDHKAKSHNNCPTWHNKSLKHWCQLTHQEIYLHNLEQNSFCILGDFPLVCSCNALCSQCHKLPKSSLVHQQ